MDRNYDVITFVFKIPLLKETLGCLCITVFILKISLQTVFFLDTSFLVMSIQSRDLLQTMNMHYH